MSRLIKVIPKNQSVCIDIEIGNVCNYSCSYCHPSSHNGNLWLEYDSLVNFIDEVSKEKYVIIVLSGGEPTLYPRIDDILKHLRRELIYLTITTNGSRSLNWWKKRATYFDKIIFSYQPEFVNFNEFYKKIEYISQMTNTQINVSMMIDKFDECYKAARKLKRIDNIEIVLKALKNKKTNKLYEYTDEQFQVMSGRLLNKNIKIESGVKHVYDNGKTILKGTQEILSEDLNRYKGWKCWKGIDLIKIQSSGKYYLASCDLKYSKYYGDIKDKPKFPTKPTICEYDYCFCICDIYNIRKER